MFESSITTTREIRHFHLFCGLGGGAKGFNNARAEAMQVGTMSARYRCVGGVDVDPASIRDFTKAAGVPGTVLDMFDREQFIAFHDREPGPDWREATPFDIQCAAGSEKPNIVFLSAPCKGFSGLLSETRSKSEKYQALNRLTLRGVWLMLEAWADDPPELILFENVPRIQKRGRKLLDHIGALLRSYGYVVAETTHDCGELGGLAQSRKRFLLVARHGVKVPPFLYEPPKRALRGVGEILGRMPLPGAGVGGPMHRVPSLQWQTWVRLAFVEAGSDWRSLNKLQVRDGQLADFLIVPEMHNGALGVNQWGEAAGTVTAGGRPAQGTFSVADPRFEGYGDSEARAVGGVGKWDQPAATVTGQRSPIQGRFSVADPRFAESDKWQDGQQYGVKAWEQPAPTISGHAAAGGGAYSVSDPRGGMADTKHNNCFRIVRWDQASQAVTGGAGPSSGGLAVADPRATDRRSCAMGVLEWGQPAGTVAGESLPSNGTFAVADPRSTGPREGSGKYRVTGFDEPAPTVIAGSTTGQGAFAVADVRMGWDAETAHGSKLEVLPYDEPAKTVTGARVGSGGMCVADPRPGMADRKTDYLTGGHYGVLPWGKSSGAVSAAACHDNGAWSVADHRLPTATERGVVVIRSLDGTWHRPFTTLELAALQSLVNPEDFLQLDGMNDQEWRERIGNAVPPEAAQAIAETMGRTLLLAWSGTGFQLSTLPIWVQPMAIALSVKQPVIED